MVPETKPLLALAVLLAELVKPTIAVGDTNRNVATGFFVAVAFI